MMKNVSVSFIKSLVYLDTSVWCSLDVSAFSQYQEKEELVMYIVHIHFLEFPFISRNITKTTYPFTYSTWSFSLTMCATLHGSFCRPVCLIFYSPILINGTTMIKNYIAESSNANIKSKYHTTISWSIMKLFCNNKASKNKKINALKSLKSNHMQ